MQDTQQVDEEKLVVWWGPDLNKEDVFVLPVVTVEEGIKTLSLLTAYGEFLSAHGFASKDTVGSGALGFLTPQGELKPWSHVSIAHGGEKFTDPMKWLEFKYNKSSIIT